MRSGLRNRFPAWLRKNRAVPMQLVPLRGLSACKCLVSSPEHSGDRFEGSHGW